MVLRNEEVRVLRLGRGGGFAGADGPYGLVGDDQSGQLSWPEPLSSVLELPFQNLESFLRFPLIQRLPTHTTGVNPLPKAAFSFLATPSSVSPKSGALARVPQQNHPQPASLSWAAEISR